MDWRNPVCNARLRGSQARDSGVRCSWFRDLVKLGGALLPSRVELHSTFNRPQFGTSPRRRSRCASAAPSSLHALTLVEGQHGSAGASPHRVSWAHSVIHSVIESRVPRRSRWDVQTIHSLCMKTLAFHLSAVALMTSA